MYKELFNTIVALIFRPAEAWKNLSAREDEDNGMFMSKFLYPLMGLITLCAFIGVLLTRKEFDVQVALKSAIMALLAYLGGFFLASSLLNEIWLRIYHRKKDLGLCQRFVGYSSVLIFVVSILLSLLPQSFFFRFLVLYTIYIVWEGAATYMKVGEEGRLKFAITVTVIILITPLLIEFLLAAILPGLRRV